MSAVTLETVATGLEPYRAQLTRMAARGTEPRWRQAQREDAMARAERRGFPGPDDEAWRFTSVAPIARGAFEGAAEPPAEVPEDLRALRLGADAVAAEIVLVNGRFAAGLSTAPPDGLQVMTLAQALAARPELVEVHLGQLAGSASVFTDLNTALAEDGAVILLGEGTVVERPIHVLHLNTGGAAMAHTRTLVVAARASQATVVQTWASAGGPSLSTSVTEIVLEDGALVDHYRLQQEGAEAFHVSSLHVRQRRDSRFTDHALLLGGALARTDADVVLDGPGAEATLDGLFMARERQHLDAHTRIEHAQPHGTSRELYNGVLDGRSRGVFHGLIVVQPHAQKTSAFQSNHNLLLSREALVNSTPALEILADDVKCKHGSTTGQLDAQSLFYLRARGIGLDAARALLVYAFASEVVARVAVPAVRRRLEGLMAERLPGAPQEILQ